MIEIAVRHGVGDFTILADIRASGRVLALCGPSGAGKTTLLNLIAGLDRPNEGRIAVEGVVFVDTASGVDTPARSRRIGYVFQEPRLFPHLSVAGNMRYGERFAPKSERFVELTRVVELLGLKDLLARKPRNLSGGEKQRVAIGRALMANPRLLLLDEPLSALDDARRLEILSYIERMRDIFAIPIIFVSHRVSEVERLASNIVTLERGRVVDAWAVAGRK